MGREAAAVPLCRAALEGRLNPEHGPSAVIQFASALRNVGDPAEAVVLLEALPDDADAVGRDAFVALALQDACRPTEVLVLALRRLAPIVPGYVRSIAAYAEELADRARAGAAHSGKS